ncbi:MAG: PGPGW domain-containing protein [Myxococcota bacterium]
MLQATYFKRPRRGEERRGNLGHVVGYVVLGGTLVFVGILMLLLPGQGILTALVGLSLMTFPGKNRALQWVLKQSVVLRAANAIRRRAGKPPFESSN